MDGSVAFRLTAYLCHTESGCFFVLKTNKKSLIQVHLVQYLHVLFHVLLVALSVLITTLQPTDKIAKNQYLSFPQWDPIPLPLPADMASVAELSKKMDDLNRETTSSLKSFVKAVKASTSTPAAPLRHPQKPVFHSLPKKVISFPKQ